jgi:hypothetical protein
VRKKRKKKRLCGVSCGVKFHWTTKEKTSNRRRGDRRREECLLERMSLFLLSPPLTSSHLLSPQRLRASCSIFFPL